MIAVGMSVPQTRPARAEAKMSAKIRSVIETANTREAVTGIRTATAIVTEAETEMEDATVTEVETATGAEIVTGAEIATAAATVTAAATEVATVTVVPIAQTGEPMATTIPPKLINDANVLCHY
jgi:hypothetical protein